MSIQTHICGNCAKEFTTKRNWIRDRLKPTRYCGPVCSSEGLSKKFAEARAKRTHEKRAKVKECPGCGAFYSLLGGQMVYCTPSCKADTKRAIEENRYRSKHLADKIRDALAEKPRPCKACGKAFTSDPHDRRGLVCCSQACKRRHERNSKKKNKMVRRRIAMASYVDPLQVFARDKWTCQLCRTTTPKRLRGTILDRAPELDHTVPLSKGGEHTYWNTQCLCRKCNGIKGAAAAGQTMLAI